MIIFNLKLVTVNLNLAYKSLLQMGFQKDAGDTGYTTCSIFENLKKTHGDPVVLTIRARLTEDLGVTRDA
jgi:hypothetical protein